MTKNLPISKPLYARLERKAAEQNKTVSEIIESIILKKIAEDKKS